MEMKTKSEIVLECIKETKMSIPEFARRINIPYTTLLSILKNDLDSASLSNVTKICDGIGKPLNKIREMAGEIEPKDQPLKDEDMEIAKLISSNNDLKRIYNLLIEADREDMYLIYELTKRLVLSK